MIRQAVRIRCSEIWGGIRNVDLDMVTTGLEISLYSRSCNGGKGGDIYYFSVCGDDALTRAALADVVGHGESVTPISQWMYDSLAERMNSLEGNQILADLNRSMARQGVESMTTAAIVSYYAVTSTLYVSLAGHPPPLLRRKADRTWRPIGIPEKPGLVNIPLGLPVSGGYDQDEFPLYRGDCLALYTDGLTEAPDDSGNQFGDSRLLEVLNTSGSATVSEMKEALLSALFAHSGGLSDQDDMTVMLMEVR